MPFLIPVAGLFGVGYVINSIKEAINPEPKHDFTKYALLAVGAYVALKYGKKLIK